jgi:hypothetical protein
LEVTLLARAVWKRSQRGRVLGLIGVLVIAGAPAAVLRAACWGRSCEKPAKAIAKIPFCSLPAGLRLPITAGFRAGRSPDLYIVDKSSPLFDARARVPLVFFGAGVKSGAKIPTGTRLDRVAPTIASILRFRRPHPEVRSGRPIEDLATREVPRLVLEVVWKGGDSEQLRASPGRWPVLERLMSAGAATLDATPGALPLDPVATMTTIGTGGIPAQHGMTGRAIRSDAGRVVRAWGRRSPPSVIATLADDLDEKMRNRPRIGLLAHATSDRGLIGGDWYVDVDEDDIVATGAERVLESGYGDDRIPDFFAAIVTGPATDMNDQLGSLVRAAAGVAKGSVLVVFTATGSSPPIDRPFGDLAGVEAMTSGGLFLDQDRLASGETTEDAIVASVKEASPDTTEVFSDTAITLSRYC